MDPSPETTPLPSTVTLGRPGRTRSVGLVLGAGGVAGYAFHIGALAALGEHGRFDARGADLIVGTSAGAAIGSLLRAGLSGADLYAHRLGRTLSPEGDALVALLPALAWDGGPEHRPRQGPASVLLAARGLLRWPPRPGVMLAGALRRGVRSPTPLGEHHRALHARWPAASLWLCAVRMRDGRRVVFGRDDHPPLDVGRAVAASCAVPRRFSPVAVHDEQYVDGGTWSATNADLLAHVGFDVVVIIAPLSTPHGLRATGRLLAAARQDGCKPRRLVARAYHRAVLQAEVRRVLRSGTPVVTIEPTQDDLVVLDARGPSPDGGVDIAEQAFASVAARLRSDHELAVLLTPTVVS